MTLGRPLERLRHAGGQVLSIQDLRDEQAYFLDRLRRHHRFLHGWGIVTGLEVTLSGPGEVTVQPGLAIDCAGNEVIVFDAAPVLIVGSAEVQFVVVHHVEHGVAPVPGLQTDPALDPEPIFTRVREGAACSVVEANPAARHSGRGPGTPGCGQPHAVVLARLRHEASGWKLTPVRRVRRAR